MLSNLEIEAKLIVSADGNRFVVVAHEHYIIVNFKDYKALDGVVKLATEKLKAKPSTSDKNSSKSSSGGTFKKLNELNDKIRELGLVVDIRVAGKTYVEFGSNKTARITASAVLGKIGSYFGL